MTEEILIEPIFVRCEECHKKPQHCVCALAKPIETKLKIVILQHPQEPREALSTAPLLKKGIVGCEIKIGLSWPNIKKVLNKEEVNSKKWAVAYLGSGVKGSATEVENHKKKKVLFVDLKGNALPGDQQFKLKNQLEGIIFIDGTWSQAKALWWRNAWLTKLNRMIIFPEQPSVYGKMRKEPRKECLSTLESAVFTLKSLGEKPEMFTSLEENLAQLLLNVKKSR